MAKKAALTLLLGIVLAEGCHQCARLRHSEQAPLLPPVKIPRSGLAHPRGGYGLSLDRNSIPQDIPKEFWVYRIERSSFSRAAAKEIAQSFGLRDARIVIVPGNGPFCFDTWRIAANDFVLDLDPRHATWSYYRQGGRRSWLKKASTTSKEELPPVLGNTQVLEKALPFLKKKGLLPREYYYEGVESMTSTTWGPGDPPGGITRILDYEVVLRRRFGAYDGAGENLFIRVVLNLHGDVIQVDHDMPKVRKWRRYPARPIVDSFDALNRGEGQVVSSVLRGGVATFAGVEYRGESDPTEFVQPVYVFVIRKSEKEQWFFFAPALKDDCYNSLPPITEKWVEDRVPNELLDERVKRLRGDIEVQEAAIWRVGRQTHNEINRLQERRLKCLEIWEQALANLSPRTDGGFVSFGMKKAEGYFRKAEASMSQRKMSRPIDAEYVMHAEEILRILSRRPGVPELAKKMRTKYARVHDWVSTSEWEQESEETK